MTGRARRKDGWRLARGAGWLELSRRGPARFDVAAVTELPRDLAPATLAHAIRRDLWRALQGLRGFTPAVRVEETAAGLRVTAGGAVDRPPPGVEAQIADLLAAPAHRDRWIAHAGRRRREGRA